MRIEAFAAQRDEQVAGLDGTAVGMHAGELPRAIAFDARAGDPARGLLQVGHRLFRCRFRVHIDTHADSHADTPRAASARRTCSRSENGRLRPWISCVASWPLPATSTTSFVPACLTA